jgi:AraC family transcriptional regulator
MGPDAVMERVDAASGKRECFRPDALQLSSADRWNGIRLECRVDRPGAIPEGYWLKHVILVHRIPPAHCERCEPGRGWHQLALTTWSVEIFPAKSVYASRWDGFPNDLLLEVAPELLTIAARRATRERLELRPFVGAEDPFIAHAALALEHDLCAGSPTGARYGESLGTALAAHLVRWHTDVTQHQSASAAFSRESLERHLETNLSIHHLADFVQMDVYRFIRLFKHSTGLPPHQYILRERIERAKSLLKNSSLPVTEIALRSGFADQSHFTTVFHRITHLRPSEYRCAVR